MCSNLTITTYEKNIIDNVLVSLLLALNMFYNFFYCFYCWLWRPHCICLAQIYIGKRSKYFKASDFPCYILNNNHFFLETRQKNLKKFMIRGKAVSQQTKLYIQKMRIIYTKLQNYSLCCRLTKRYMWKIPSVTRIMCAKCQNYNICI